MYSSSASSDSDSDNATTFTKFKIKTENDSNINESVSDADDNFVEEFEGPNVADEISLQTFFKNNPNLKQQSDKSFLNVNIDENEEEVFLLQCPKSIDKRQLNGLLIQKRSKPQSNNNLDTVMEKFQDSGKSISFGIKIRDKVVSKNLNISCVVQVKEHIEPLPHSIKEEVTVRQPKETRVPFPENIQIRHPLLGKNYVEKLELADKIVHQLLDAKYNNLQPKLVHIKMEAQSPIRSPSKMKRKSTISLSEDHIKKELESSFESEGSPSKQHKKNKSRKHDIIMDDDELPEDLSWIDNL